MKISFQILGVHPGGAEKVLCALANGLAENGHDVIIWCVKGYGSRSFFDLSPKIQVHEIQGWDYGMLFGGKIKIIRDLCRIGKMYRIFRREKPDAAVSFLTNMIIPSAWGALLAGVPHVACERNSPWDKPEYARKRNRRNRAFAVSRGCVMQTDEVLHYFSDRIQKKAVVIPNPVLVDEQLRENRIPFSARDRRIVSVGRLVPQKNHLLLLEGFDRFFLRHPEYRLEIYGTGPEQDSLQAYLMNHPSGEHVSLITPVKDIHRRIQNASMFIMTSDYEGYPNALAEAVALGIPCVSTNCRSGGPKAILKGGEAGLLIPVGSPDALAEAMSRIAESDLGDRLSQAGQEALFSDRNTVVRMWEQYLREIAE